VSIEYAEEARLDLVSAITYLAERSPAAATDFAERLEQAVGRLGARAVHGPEEVLRSGDRVHSWPVYPFRIYYQRRGETLYVLRVYHQARTPLVKRTAQRKTRTAD
jgi:plasmid stabilization system protein ParE